jgi:hypothetical protein
MKNKFNLVQLFIVFLLPIHPGFMANHRLIPDSSLNIAEQTSLGIKTAELKSQNQDDNVLEASYSYAYFDEIGNIWIKLVDQVEPFQLTFRQENDPHYTHIEWSPDGSKLAYVRLNDIGGAFGDPGILHVYDLATRKEKEFNIDIVSFDWSPNSKEIVYSRSFEFDYSYDNNSYTFQKADGIWLLDLDTGLPRELIPASGYPLTSAAFSPSGKNILIQESIDFNLNLWNIKIFDQENPSQMFVLDFKGGCAWSPVEDILACTEVDGINYPTNSDQIPCTTIVVDPNGVEVDRLPVLTDDSCDLELAWSPNGNVLLIRTRRFVSPRNLGDVDDFYFFDTKTRVELDDTYFSGTWTPDSSWIEHINWSSENAEFMVSYHNIQTGEVIPWRGRSFWQPMANASPDLESYIQRKETAIQALQEIDFDVWGLDDVASVTAGAFEETAAQNLLAEIREKSTLTPEEFAAFERFIIQEETLETILPSLTVAARNKSETFVDLFGVLFGLVTLFATAPDPLKGIAASIATTVTDEYLLRSERIDHQSPDREFYEFLYTTFQQDVDLHGLGLAIIEFGIGSEIRKAVIPRYITHYAESIEPTLDYGAGSVLNPGTLSWNVTGTPGMAMMQAEHLEYQANLSAETSTSMLQDIERGSALNDIFKDLSDIFTQSTGTPISPILLISLGTRIIDEILIYWSDAIAQKAYSCIVRTSAVAGQTVFQPDQALFQCPEMQDMDSIPTWIEDLLSQPLWPSLLGSADHFVNQILITNQQIAGGNDDQVQSAYADLRLAASDLQGNVQAARRLLEVPEAEYSTAILDSLDVDLMSLQLNTALIRMMMDENFLNQTDAAAIRTMAEDRAQKISEARNSISTIMESAPTSSNKQTAISIPVILGLPDYLEVGEGQAIDLQFNIGNYGTSKSKDLTLVAQLPDSSPDIIELSGIDAQDEVPIEISMVYPKAMDDTLTFTLTEDGSNSPIVKRIPILSTKIEEQPASDGIVEASTTQEADVPLNGILIFGLGLVVFAAGALGIAIYIKKRGNE